MINLKVQAKLVKNNTELQKDTKVKSREIIALNSIVHKKNKNSKWYETKYLLGYCNKNVCVNEYKFKNFLSYVFIIIIKIDFLKIAIKLKQKTKKKSEKHRKVSNYKLSCILYFSSNIKQLYTH